TASPHRRSGRRGAGGVPGRRRLRSGVGRCGALRSSGPPPTSVSGPSESAATFHGAPDGLSLGRMASNWTEMLRSRFAWQTWVIILRTDRTGADPGSSRPSDSLVRLAVGGRPLDLDLVDDRPDALDLGGPGHGDLLEVMRGEV